MSLKLACMAATAAWIASAAGAFAADVAAGEAIFNQKCKVCHAIGEGAKNFVGPELNGLIGRKTGAVEGYSYSDANKNSGITWDETNLNEYLANPKSKVPGTKMIFAGLPKDSDRENLVAFLAQFGPTGAKK
ncbi:c-type cytochrome [Methylocapsa palsarum]|uniref:Cytochrome c n=1 Tax=Methylocapsa palsarum TaxID=1612308 RepID=A0A1I3W9H7_9HYPH|nr:cytochrome c family protein [Methylocapsa palsarum]SFK04324.1 cytochrome c [Methylocapsa palsarum]